VPFIFGHPAFLIILKNLSKSKKNLFPQPLQKNYRIPSLSKNSYSRNPCNKFLFPQPLQKNYRIPSLSKNDDTLPTFKKTKLHVSRVRMRLGT
jgi:hypothetical protein